MSFTSMVKNEVSKLNKEKIYDLSELSAIITNVGSYHDKLSITTENASVARRVFTLLKSIYHLNPKITVRKGYNFTKNYLYIVEILNKQEQVLSDLGLFDNQKRDIPYQYIVGDEQLTRAYLRGLFISVGSINDPKKSRYHLEFLVSNYEYALFVQKLLNTFDLNSKIIKRETKYMIYIKEAEKIGDFLRIIEATSALLYYEDIRIYRDHKNMTNRLNNCEQANVDKIIIASDSQVDDINVIIASGGMDLLSDKEQVAAKYRLKYNDASLLELSEIISIETNNIITKSGLYHRFRKIKELANRIRKSN